MTHDPPATDTAYVIWSFEHGAWWRPGRMGYTDIFVEAGHYSQAEAEEIVRDANVHRTAPYEWLFPLERAAAFVAKGWHPLTPGTYDDGRDGLHLVLEEMLAGHGYADTPENRQALIDAARQQVGNVIVEE